LEENNASKGADKLRGKQVKVVVEEY